MLMRLQHKRPDGEVDTYHLKPGRKYHLGRGSACELRILDLKLSRKHCCIEFVDGVWQIEDLGSTNGCKVNGAQIVGTRVLEKDAKIEAGTTTVVVTAFIDPSQAADAPSGASPALQQEALPEGGGEPSMSDSAISSSDWDPEPVAENLVKTGALQPVAKAGARPAPAIQAAARAKPAQSEGDGNATLAPNTMFAAASALTPRAQPEPPPVAVAPKPVAPPPPPPPPVFLDSPPTAETRPAPRIKPVTIRVGRVDGGEEHAAPSEEPLLNEVSAASTLAAPVEPPPQPIAPITVATASTPAARPATDSGEERTFFITVLGRRIGPLSRAVARDLKAKELKGLLTLSDLDSYPKA